MTRPSASGDLLSTLGRRVRGARRARGWTLDALARAARLSRRFLAQLETGRGNISVARLSDVARALETSAAALLAPNPSEKAVIALLGVRGAGKSTVGTRLARRLGVPFYELDALVEGEAGLRVAEIFAMHGEAYFRRLERQVLGRLLDRAERAVVATGGGLVTDRETWALLRERAVTLWLKADASDHWRRVILQGDRRPMAGKPQARAELRNLLRARKPLYAQADHVVDTSRGGIGATVRAAVRGAERALGRPSSPTPTFPARTS